MELVRWKNSRLATFATNECITFRPPAIRKFANDDDGWEIVDALLAQFERDAGRMLAHPFCIDCKSSYVLPTEIPDEPENVRRVEPLPAVVIAAAEYARGCCGRLPVAPLQVKQISTCSPNLRFKPK